MDGNAQLYASIGHSACQPKTFSCSVSQTPVFSYWSTCLVMCCLPLLLLLLLRIPSHHAHDTREHGRVTCVLEDLMHALSKLCPLSSTVLGSAVRSKKRGLEQFEPQCPNCKVPGSQESSHSGSAHPEYSFSPPSSVHHILRLSWLAHVRWRVPVRFILISVEVFVQSFARNGSSAYVLLVFHWQALIMRFCDESVPTFQYVLVLSGIAQYECQFELVRICSASLLPTGGIRGASPPATVSCPVPPISLTV